MSTQVKLQLTSGDVQFWAVFWLLLQAATRAAKLIIASCQAMRRMRPPEQCTRVQ